MYYISSNYISTKQKEKLGFNIVFNTYVISVVSYYSSVIINENQLSSAHNVLNTTIFQTTNKQTSHNNRSNWLLLNKASS